MLLDRKPESKVGTKVCGDEISKTHFEATAIDYPKGNEVSSIIAGADVYPPSLDNKLDVRGWKDFDGWTVNRLIFGQRLLQEAVQVGAKFIPESHVTGVIMKGEQVVGIDYKLLTSGEKYSLKSKLVVDASGFASEVRKKIYSPFVEQTIKKSDIALCYREILKLKMPLAEPEVARVLLGGKYSPGGYSWIFPKGAQEVNAGVGVTGGKGKGSPKSLFMAFKEEYPLLFGSTVLEAGGGAVPVRRPIWSLVANGVAFIGDAASMVNPIHGGGIGAGMRAGVILGEIAKESIARRDLSVKGLWSFNRRFLRNFGRRLASLEIFKRLLTDVTDDEMDYGFRKRLLEASDLMAANVGDGFSIGFVGKMRRMKRGIRRVSLLLKLQKAASLMKKIDKEYASYPSRPSGLEKWKTTVQDLIDAAVFKK